MVKMTQVEIRFGLVLIFQVVPSLASFGTDLKMENRTLCCWQITHRQASIIRCLTLFFIDICRRYTIIAAAKNAANSRAVDQ